MALLTKISLLPEIKKCKQLHYCTIRFIFVTMLERNNVLKILIEEKNVIQFNLYI